MLRRIVVALEGRRCLVLYPAGGLEVQAHVPGVGWTLDEEAGGDFGAVLNEAAGMLSRAAEFAVPTGS